MSLGQVHIPALDDVLFEYVVYEVVLKYLVLDLERCVASGADGGYPTVVPGRSVEWCVVSVGFCVDSYYVDRRINKARRGGYLQVVGICSCRSAPLKRGCKRRCPCRL